MISCGIRSRGNEAIPLRGLAEEAEEEEAEMDIKSLIKTVNRRRSWLLTGLDGSKLLNLMSLGKDYVLSKEEVKALPAIVKIDISPICNLHCTVCVHASPDGDELLERQSFKSSHRMTVEQFTKIIDAIKGKTLAVSLYTWGDPMTHPDLDEMCRIASSAGLQVHISTNFSFAFKDDRIRSIVESGMTHLTVCVDGLTQENYEKTRVGGRIDRVLSNLERVCKVRNELGRKFPMVEVQYIKFQHNAHEEEETEKICRGYGANEFSSFWGELHNWSEREPDRYETLGKKEKNVAGLPGCFWPYFSIVVKYDGSVIPCCTHRRTAQHAEDGDAREFKNVFETSLAEIWNSQEYREARRLSSDASRVSTEPGLKDHFCYGCSTIFEVDDQETVKHATKYEFDELYVLDAKGKPHRKDSA